MENARIKIHGNEIRPENYTRFLKQTVRVSPRIIVEGIDSPDVINILGLHYRVYHYDFINKETVYALQSLE